MPTFDLRYIKAAKYVNTNGVVSYTGATLLGDAMTVDMQLKYAEGRLYAEGGLAEYLKLVTGGTISIGVKYMQADAQKMLFGARDKSRSVGSGEKAVTVKSLQYGQLDMADYVGVAFYAPDKIDGVTKYTGALVTRALFGLPSLSYKTKGDNIEFKTPTTTGELLADHSSTQEIIEVAIVETPEIAKAWVDLVLGGGA